MKGRHAKLDARAIFQARQNRQSATLAEQILWQLVRQRWLEEQGFFVLRFKNEQVQERALDVLRGIELVCRALDS